jgi:TRAP-type mannitol/chloroaromatic compound transport system substrate-binding protein
MKRRLFLTNSAIAATTAATLVSCQSNNSPTVQDNSLPKLRWKMVTSWPRSLETIFGGAETGWSL